MLHSRKGTELNSAETKRGRVGRCRGELAENHWRALVEMLVTVTGTPVFANWYLPSSVPLLSQRLEKQGSELS